MMDPSAEAKLDGQELNEDEAKSEEAKDKSMDKSINETATKKPVAKRGRGRPVKEEKQPLWSDILGQIFKEPNFILTIGKPKQGKSYMVRYFLHYGLSSNIFKFGIVFQGSAEMNSDYSSFLPKKAVVTYSEDKLKRYIEQLTAHKKKLMSEGKEDQMPRSFIVLDDILGQLSRSDYTTHFFSLYRHLNITVFLNSQYISSNASSTICRNIASFAFFFRSSNASSTKTIHEWFGNTSGLDLKEFKTYFNRTTAEPFTCMLYIDGENTAENNYLKHNKQYKH